MNLLRFLLVGVVLLACQKDPNVPGTTVAYDGTPYVLNHGAFPPPPIAADNPLTVQGVMLGRMLFYEKRLSGNNTMACADCHRQEHAFTDTARFSTGILGFQGGRQAMAVFNMAWNTNRFFWDGRSLLLRDQSLKPIQDSLEMHETLPNAIAKLQADPTYTNQFIRAFGSPEITAEKMARAMEQFMNSIVSVNSKYDRFLAGQTTLSPAEERGRKLFFTEYNPFFPDSSGADCAHCHGGLNFENDQFMNNGLDPQALQDDPGFASVTQNQADWAKFKVTSLRNVELTAPYMHDGRFKTLEEVVAHYNNGIQASPTLDPALDMTLPGGLMLTLQDISDLVAFLKTLTDTNLPTDPAYAKP